MERSTNPIQLPPEKEPLIITGPTGAGKTQLAHRLFGTFFHQIVNVDSRQMIRGMDIGTSKPRSDRVNNEIEKYNYQFIDCLNPSEPFDACQFTHESLKIIKNFPSRSLILGGTVFYLQSLLAGLPQHSTIPIEIKNKIESIWLERGTQGLAHILKDKDPQYYEIIDRNNSARLKRALEVVWAFDMTMTELRAQRKSLLKNKPLMLIPFLPREELYQNINQRIDKMLAKGLVREVKDLYQLVKDKPENNFFCRWKKTIGYREIIQYLQGECDLEQAVENIKVNTRKYAKQQIKWFRDYPKVVYFSSVPFEAVQKKEDQWVKNLKQASFFSVYEDLIKYLKNYFKECQK